MMEKKQIIKIRKILFTLFLTSYLLPIQCSYTTKRAGRTVGSGDITAAIDTLHKSGFPDTDAVPPAVKTSSLTPPTHDRGITALIDPLVSGSGHIAQSTMIMNPDGEESSTGPGRLIKYKKGTPTKHKPLPSEITGAADKASKKDEWLSIEDMTTPLIEGDEPSSVWGEWQWISIPTIGGGWVTALLYIIVKSHRKGEEVKDFFDDRFTPPDEDGDKYSEEGK